MIKKTIFRSLVLTLILLNILVLTQKSKTNSYKILTMFPKNINQNQMIFKLGQKQKINFISEPSFKLNPVSAIVDEVKHRNFIQFLDQNKIVYKLEKTDSLLARIEKQTERQFKPKTRIDQKFDYDNTYHTLDEIYKELDRLSITDNNVCVNTIGQTYEKRDIRAIKLFGNQRKDRIVVLECGAHAREWISPTICLWFINKLINNHSLTKVYDFIILPVLNPDGYVYTWSNETIDYYPPRLWRKNRQTNPYPDAWTEPDYGEEWMEDHKNSGDFDLCIGIDLNRNYLTQEFCNDKFGYLLDPCWVTFCGKQPFRAYEVKAFTDYLITQKEKLFAYFSFHNYYQLWMYPPSHTNESVVPNDSQLANLSKIAVQAIKSKHGTEYGYGKVSDMFLSSGDSISWVYYTLNVSIAFGIEARPEIDDSEGFLIGEHAIKPNAEELFAGLEAVLNELSKDLEPIENLIPKDTDEPNGSFTRSIPSLIHTIIWIIFIRFSVFHT